MNNSLKDAYIAKWEARVEQLDAYLASKRADAKHSAAEARITMAHVIEQFEARIEDFKDRLAAARQSGLQQWEQLERNLTKVGNELEGGWAALQKHLSKQEEGTSSQTSAGTSSRSES